jgi:hypothetical protein
MRWRCKPEPHKKYTQNYGSRGIRVCERWENFESFYEDMHEGYADHLTLERIDVNGPYCKENCCWVSNMEQQSNKRNNRVLEYQGEQLHLAELCRRVGMTRGKLTAYLNRGLSAEEAVAKARASTYGRGPSAVKNRSSTTL